MSRIRVTAVVGSMILALGLSTTFVAPPVHAATITELRAGVLKLVNAERAKVGCQPLRGNRALKRAAQRHSTAMADAKTMSHQLPGEAAPDQRITSAGYHWTEIGENVAYGYATPARVMRAWMHSEGHRANILHCGYRDLGIGIVKRGRTFWWTQDFGRRQG